jgi:hypothetical protein
MDIAQRQEQFSLAYLRAVAAVAGFTVYKPEVDDDSIDIGVAGRGADGSTRSPRVELQVKCTSQQGMLTPEHLAFPLLLKNYNDLRPENVLVPRILLVVVVPENLDEWLIQTEEHLAMRRCGYWVSLRGMGETTNTTSVTVHLPRSQVFTVVELQEIMQRIQTGGLP